jgi:hypothetical protein
MKNEKSLNAEIGTVRTKFRTNARLRLEFLGKLSKLLREHGVQVSDELFASIVLAIPAEIGGAAGPPAIDPPASRTSRR